ncbi:beta-xylosidase [Dysgonomonas sp. PFB1-18]|uniref:arabinan endo-1,5-alpha-L-arabinosidase n=1 Tax=unclassified Dysgonomonas TaxID=2630389 RepID=UPI0024751D23|nr:MULTISPECIES: arabinan endo-1,5-alpha-L-arabinosidase [unclassified Dysgonomonas]MDH6308390.1 beta-xylosidase [Dysgonomonas sp. PF1-14]MDH6338173.1 beta-xylosidase [Dysgonomonas sp. PF1-16]MDH6379670.1 beta-xylosidase [Dysgonomonas sp. PFB1-18]MDH6397241.1 beta-xylosidase [Dysgonomonas sp. PF1-23]
MKQHYKWFSLLVICALLFGACSDDDKDFGEQGVIIETPVVSEITSYSVQLQATLAAASDITLGKRGFCYSTQANPDIYSSTVVATGNEDFSATISGLTINTTYYIRAFVSIYNGGVAYSPQIEVLTGEGSLDEQLAQYKAPAYADNYASIAAWDKRDQWNLANVHDPSVVLAEDGYYYMYQTDASYGNVHVGHGHFHARRSKDLVNWEYLGGTMQDLPAWVVPKLNEIRAEMGLPASTGEGEFGYWAPCVRKVQNGLYRMYYSIVCPGLLNGDGSWGERAFIGMMENTDPANNDGWVDKGYVVTNASDKGLNFYVQADDWANCYYKWNAIDPSYIITAEGAHWLIYGSWHSGLVAMELNSTTGMPKQDLGIPWADGNAPAEYGQIIHTRQAGNRWQASEGPELVYNAATGYYYLFVAYDALGVPYNTRVARSKNITGPYLGIDGANVTEGAEMLPVVTHPYKFANTNGWVGFAHCAVFDDGNGNWYYSSQGRLPESVDNAIMMGHVRSIRWTKDGWPLVMPERYGAVPKVAITEEELIGNWDHIDMSYSYGRQKESSVMTLTAEHTVSEGTWKNASWSYDADNQILTVNGVDLYLQREADWEANPRTHTIVYAAYGGNNKTYWGKKAK